MFIWILLPWRLRNLITTLFSICDTSQTILLFPSFFVSLPLFKGLLLFRTRTDAVEYNFTLISSLNEVVLLPVLVRLPPFLGMSSPL